MEHYFVFKLKFLSFGQILTYYIKIKIWGHRQSLVSHFQVSLNFVRLKRGHSFKKMLIGLALGPSAKV